MTGIFKKNNFIERSIMGALSFLKDSIFSQDYARRKGMLQSIEPKIKVIGIFSFVITALFIKHTLLLVILYLICMLLVYCSKIDLGYFLKRTWIFIPLFSIFIALPALFNVFTPGEALFTFSVIGVDFTITRPGLAGALLFVTRVITSVSLVVLLTLTTKHFELLRALRVFGVPQIFVMTIGMSYRYIYLFVEVIENTYFAIKSRIGGALHYRKGQKIVGWHIANLWHRSVELNRGVYSAMLSRGYAGEPVILDESKIRILDCLWLLGVFFSCLVLLNLRTWKI